MHVVIVGQGERRLEGLVRECHAHVTSLSPAQLAAWARAAHRASWWETLRSPQEKMPQREACLEAGYIATRQTDGKSVKFKEIPRDRRTQGKSGGPE